MDNQNKTRYVLTVDYKPYKPLTYKGVVISKTTNDGHLEEVCRSNTGNHYLDMYIVDESDLLEFGVEIQFLSSWDDYIMDLEDANPIIKLLHNFKHRKINREWYLMMSKEDRDLYE